MKPTQVRFARPERNPAPPAASLPTCSVSATVSRRRRSLRCCGRGSNFSANALSGPFRSGKDASETFVRPRSPRSDTPVARMPRPPLPHPSTIFRPPEVVLVLRFGQPAVLAQRLRNLATLWRGYDFGNLEGTTHDNADICTLRFASLADCNSAPEAQRNPTAPIKKSPARQLEESQEQHAGRRVLS
jgi:hypothetical protein